MLTQVNHEWISFLIMCVLQRLKLSQWSWCKRGLLNRASLYRISTHFSTLIPPIIIDILKIKLYWQRYHSFKEVLHWYLIMCTNPQINIVDFVIIYPEKHFIAVKLMVPEFDCLLPLNFSEACCNMMFLNLS